MLAVGVPIVVVACGGGPDLTAFVDCLNTDQKAIFYGAFWCPHCQDQKRVFGNAAGDLPYVECSTPDGNGQTTVCQQKQIVSYPTWEFADGRRESRILTVSELAARTQCMLPVES